MQKLSGILTIKSIRGRNGYFNVGTLTTDLGEFSVKDAILEQYEEGKYEGDFGVSRIYPNSYFSSGRMVVEVRAKLETISLQSIDHDVGFPCIPEEPDPLDEAPVDIVLTTLHANDVAPPDTESAEPVPADVQSDLDAALFGELWPLSGEIKLDPTVDRAKFRTQRDRLKELGFKFSPIGQVWQKV